MLKAYKDFKEIIEDMISPLENPDFYGLILTEHNPSISGRINIRGYSCAHGYDLGSTTYEIYQKLMGIALRTYINNIDEDVYNLGKRKNSYSEIKEYFEEILDPSNPRENVESFLSSNGNFFAKSIGTLNSGLASGWFYFNNTYLEPNKITEGIQVNRVKHRLYLTVDNECRAEMAQKIIEKCEEKNLPYLFKVFISPKKKQMNQQSDTLVIYLENERQVVEYVNLINEIVQENLNLASHIYQPSPHLGKINEYIGYGFEPQIKMDGDKISYSQFMARVVNEARKRESKLFNGAAKGILKAVATQELYYFDMAKMYHDKNPSCTLESLILPNDEECKEMINFEKTKECDEELAHKMKMKIRSTISKFYRLTRSSDRKNFPRIEEALKIALVKNRDGIPLEMFGMDDIEVDFIANTLEEDISGFDENDI